MCCKGKKFAVITQVVNEIGKKLSSDKFGEWGLNFLSVMTS